MNNETEDTKKENFIERSIKTYVLRAGHFTNSEKNAYEKLHDKYCIDFSETPLDFESVFGNI